MVHARKALAPRTWRTKNKKTNKTVQSRLYRIAYIVCVGQPVPNSKSRSQQHGLCVHRARRPNILISRSLDPLGGVGRVGFGWDSRLVPTVHKSQTQTTHARAARVLVELWWFFGSTDSSGSRCLMSRRAGVFVSQVLNPKMYVFESTIHCVSPQAACVHPCIICSDYIVYVWSTPSSHIIYAHLWWELGAHAQHVHGAEGRNKHIGTQQNTGYVHDLISKVSDEI